MVLCFRQVGSDKEIISGKEREVPGENGGTAGAQVSVKDLLTKLVNVPMVKEKLQFFDDAKTLLRTTIDNARETVQRCMEITSLRLCRTL